MTQQFRVPLHWRRLQEWNHSLLKPRLEIYLQMNAGVEKLTWNNGRGSGSHIWSQCTYALILFIFVLCNFAISMALRIICSHREVVLIFIHNNHDSASLEIWFCALAATAWIQIQIRGHMHTWIRYYYLLLLYSGTFFTVWNSSNSRSPATKTFVL